VLRQIPECDETLGRDRRDDLDQLFSVGQREADVGAPSARFTVLTPCYRTMCCLDPHRLAGESAPGLVDGRSYTPTEQKCSTCAIRQSGSKYVLAEAKRETSRELVIKLRGSAEWRVACHAQKCKTGNPDSGSPFA
jgi:hypothetical protein